jgi:hypothetical protein
VTCNNGEQYTSPYIYDSMRIAREDARRYCRGERSTVPGHEWISRDRLGARSVTTNIRP